MTMAVAAVKRGERADENLARSFLLLAEQAERNTHFDISYETPPPKPREIV